jgi:hypothetical protein
LAGFAHSHLSPRLGTLEQQKVIKAAGQAMPLKEVSEEAAETVENLASDGVAVQLLKRKSDSAY